MENSAASYLHKKFKKQLSVEPKIFNSHHDRESKQVRGVEPGEEKREECNNDVADNQIGKDNNESVPNQSTNQNSSVVLNVSKSSISVEKCIANLQSANSCISYVVSSSQNVENTSSIFNATRTEPTNHAVRTSSILENVYSVKPENNISSQRDHEESCEKGETQQPPPDKTSGGKYVCPYCNMVCSKPSVLQKHIRAHTNERPYPCNSCGFSFKTRSNLYKHCRSRTHANRVMGNKAQEINNETEPMEPKSSDEEKNYKNQDLKAKPYKPRFHSGKQFCNSLTKENIEEEKHDDNAKHNSDLLSHHINEIISKNNSIVNSGSDSYLLKKRNEDNEYAQRHRTESVHNSDEPLNLTNKNRKRCMSEVVEPVAQKSLIKELLLKNLNSDMQCPHCKMIFQTVTELELHKLRSCKGFVKPGAKYSRSSSVNVASILTQNKNAFDNIPHLQNAVFPLKSPGPFLGKTRLVESDKNKSFSFDDGLSAVFPATTANDRYLLSPLTLQNNKEKKVPIKLFGGEVKITHTTGETKSFKIDNKDDGAFIEYGGKLSENRVVKSSLQSGGTVLTNKTNYVKADSLGTNSDVIRVFDNSVASPNIDLNLGKSTFSFERQPPEMNDRNSDLVIRSQIDQTGHNSPTYKYPNMMDFSQKAVKLLTPNLKQPNLGVPGIPAPNKFTFPNIEKSAELEKVRIIEPEQPQNLSKTSERPFQPKVTPSQNLYNPMNLIVDGKIFRYVPGIPGPVATEEPLNMAYSPRPRKLSPLPKPEIKQNFDKTPTKSSKMEALEVKTELGHKSPEVKSPKTDKSPVKSFDMQSPSLAETKKFARPNSLALKPTTASLKQHHGLTPTVFNQILISPDTPRVAKKYVQQYLNGNLFSYLGLKSSTKPVYCTLNKTQPFYVQHFKKLSMYSEWRQQDTKTDKLYVSAYDSRQRHQKYTTAGKSTGDLVAHSSYKFIVSETSSSEKGEDQKGNAILGGYESNEDYTYIRGRGRGRYVCDQCGIRCKKPSMLKKHIRTHSNDRPYTCNHCNFSFKTKGNLTKHMKSKAHTKNYAASGSGSSTQQSGTPSSESETEDSGMDSSDESTRREEHEAAYGLLSLSQKTSQNVTLTSHHRRESSSSPPSLHLPSTEGPLSIMNSEEIAQVSKTVYARNKFLDEKTSLNFSTPTDLGLTMTSASEPKDVQNLAHFLGKTAITRPLTYPYTIVSSSEDSKNVDLENRQAESDPSEPKSIKQFHVIQKYAPLHSLSPNKVKESSKHWTENNLKEKVFRFMNNSSKSAIKDRTKVFDEIQRPPVRVVQNVQPPVLKVNDAVVLGDTQSTLQYQVLELRKRKQLEDDYNKVKMQKNDEVMDLSMAADKNSEKLNGAQCPEEEEMIFRTSPQLTHQEHAKNINNEIYHSPKSKKFNQTNEEHEVGYKNNDYNKPPVKNNGNLLVLNPRTDVNVNYLMREQAVVNEQPKSYPSVEYDNSAMETLADIATKQVKLEKNTLAKNVASEIFKIATKNEFPSGDGTRDVIEFGGGNKDVNQLIVKPEGNKSCHICAKSFIRMSQLRLHMNIHYLERPYRCHSCSISFRTKGHLQKHERSATHHNKLSSPSALSTSEPRPFKCVDCSIAFRIHGHLAKHLRSKMHIMKLECLAKIPFGLYAELERSNSLLTEINTADGDQCLESLKTLAKKVFINDPNKLNQLSTTAEGLESVDS